MKPKHRRMILLACAALVLAGAAALVMSALEENIVFFRSPSDVVEKKFTPGRRFRIGGLVAADSVKRLPDGVTVEFKVTDLKNTVRVAFKGILPDLFREGQGIVAQGTLRADGVFQASEVLAKHDEKYMPPEVADALKKAGHWKKDGKPGAKPSAGGAYK
ncbi:MAG: cytochrome c maturation protein CcmE [Alphaproteobacteria bacterium]